MCVIYIICPLRAFRVGVSFVIVRIYESPSCPSPSLQNPPPPKLQVAPNADLLLARHAFLTNISRGGKIACRAQIALALETKLLEAQL